MKQFSFFLLLFSVFPYVTNAAEIVSGKAYKINSCFTGGKSLSTPNASLAESADVITWTETNVPAQRWIATNVSGNLFSLTNAYSEKALTESSHRPKAGDKIVQKSNDHDYSQWEFVPVANVAYPDAYYIRFSIQSEGKNLFLELADNTDGSQVKLQTKRTDADSLRQMWTVTAEDILPNRVTPAFRDSVMRGWKARFFNVLKTSTGFWGEAEMMETILDAYETTGKQEYKTMFEEVYEHFVSTPAGWYQPGNGQDWRWNDYNDDIAWAVLATVRAYLMFGQHPNSSINYLNIAKTNYDRMYSRALLPSGMLRWQETTPTNQGTNSCINGPAEIAACYLAIATNDDSYYEKAKNLYALQRQYLYDPATGKVYDSGSWNNNNVFTVGNTWVSTYNQGTFLGAALMLYNHYGTAQYKTDANKIVEWTRNDLCDNVTGVIKVCGNNDDLQGFKGILMRYLRRYVVDLALPDKVEWLQRNALQAYNNRNSQGITWTAWWDKAPESFVYPGGYSFANKPFGCSTVVSAAFNTPLSAGLIIKNAFETIEAENFDYLKGVFVERTDDTTAVVGNIAANYFTAYNHVDFGNEQATGIELLVQGSRQAGRTIEVHLDSPSGQLIGTAEIPSTDANAWVTIASTITNTDGRHHIYLVYQGSGFKIDHFRFTREGSGIENPMASSQIKIYPNPVITDLHVNAPSAGRLSVYNSLGKEIEALNISAGITTLNVTDYSAGLYIVKIITTEGVSSVKFLKK
ncbi:MAG: 4-beta-xylanase A [Candidatus Ordinivivax streblomastigis]|uniref:4-beta-xylanase A n=1 Tax=Candidatus Ordinivivax streblomastigis TaxID=2540710 RepID=A0A5M8P3T9_9BACT|nr:MAG: 4-beta-xylanase A [Candidatus Ordinivivax streblomastigis]